MHNKCLLFNTAITSRVLYLIQPKNRVVPLQWRDNERDGLSNHQPHDCLLNRLFRHRSKKASELLVTGLCAGNSVHFPYKGPVMRKMLPFDDVTLKKRFYIGLQNQRLWSKMECFFYSRIRQKAAFFKFGYEYWCTLWSPRRALAHPWGWILWGQIMPCVLPQSLCHCIQYHFVFRRVITVPVSSWRNVAVSSSIAMNMLWILAWCLILHGKGLLKRNHV